MKRIIAVLTVLALVAMPVISFAEGDAPAAPKAPAPEGAKVMHLKGKITKTEAEKDGKNIVTYTLTTADGKIVIPAPADGIKDDMLNVDVVVMAKGEEAKVEGKKVVTVKEVTAIKKVEVKKEEAAK